MKNTTLVATFLLALPIGCSLAGTDDSDSADARSEGVKAGSAVWTGARKHAEYRAFHGYGHAQDLPASMGENSAKGQVSPEAVVDARTASEGHCEVIMHPLGKQLRVGLYYRELASKDGYFWVSRFQL